MTIDDPVGLDIQHRNGVWWFRAPLPCRWHRCAPWTTGRTKTIEIVERCACGAVRLDGNGPWIDRNTRRKEERRRLFARDKIEGNDAPPWRRVLWRLSQ